MPESIVVRNLGLQDYHPVWHQMQRFTQERTPDTPDEIWILEHPSLFTLGQASKLEHLIKPGNIPVIQIDRGGQVTYHGPGQLIAYILFDLRRANMGVRKLVSALENAIIACLSNFQITAHSRHDAPGVYVEKETSIAPKIASLGLRIRRGCSYHGLALNVDMDLTPFTLINPCGFADLPVTQIRTENSGFDGESVTSSLLVQLLFQLGYSTMQLHHHLPWSEKH